MKRSSMPPGQPRPRPRTNSMAARSVARARAEALGGLQVEKSEKEKQVLHAEEQRVAAPSSARADSGGWADEQDGAESPTADAEAQDEVIVMEEVSDDDSDSSDWLHGVDVDLPDSATASAGVAAENKSQASAAPPPPPPTAPVAPSPDASPRRGSSAPRSPSRLTEPQLSPKKRGQSMFITAAVTGTTLKRGEPGKGPVSTSSHFWVNEQSKRSSRLLDEWKRKEIWHDFKKAEETVLTQPLAPADARALPASRLDELLQNLRAEIAPSTPPTDRTTEPSPLRRSMSLMAKPRDAQNEPLSELNPASMSPLETVTRAAVPPARSTPPRDIAQAAITSTQNLEHFALERQRLRAEIEALESTLAQERDAVVKLSEKVATLDTLDRENRFLKEEIQKHLMQELSSKELLKTVEDQLALTARSEEQLKLQTRQLMQQNQTLQADLLEKIAAETSKIQKMAHLSAEKQNLLEEMQRKEMQASQKAADGRLQLRMTALRYVLRAQRRRQLQFALSTWRSASHEEATARRHALQTLLRTLECGRIKALARSFRALHQNAASALHDEDTEQASSRLAVADERLALAKLSSVTKARTRGRLIDAMKTWLMNARLQGLFAAEEMAKQVERELAEAKECVFTLSRAKTRLEEKLQAANDEVRRHGEQLREQRSELTLVKHGYVTTVVRSAEREWLRTVFRAWQLHTSVQVHMKELRLQVEMAELRAEEREKYARSLDDYNKVLRNDLERFQFFSQDKRIAVDVLTKKLMREEEKVRLMEEQHVTLEEKLLAQKAQLASLLDWHGVTLPMSLLVTCRDAAVSHLRDSFHRFAATASPPVGADADLRPSGQRADDSLALVPSSRGHEHGTDDEPRLAVEALAELLALSSLGARQSSEALLTIVRRAAPEYAATRGLRFADFLECVQSVLSETLATSKASGSMAIEPSHEFWSTFLRDRSSSVRAPGQSRDSSDMLMPHAARSAWAGQLTEDILQNQEKLLAVLEHETAVVERAVMVQTGLKHPYAPSEHSVSTVTAFHEYQCDPVVPPEHSQPASSQPPLPLSPFLAPGLDAYMNWSHTGPIQDLFMAFQQPLYRVFTTYASDKRNGIPHGATRPDVFRMLEDMKLFPTYLSRDLVQHHFTRLSDRETSSLHVTGLSTFLGYCALELFAKSLNGSPPPGTLNLSAREIVLSFFCDLNFLAESEIPPPPRICLVGVEVENVLWPLFEYYATSGGTVRETATRFAMDVTRFTRFLVEISNSGALADRIYRRALGEPRRGAEGYDNQLMHFDEFYVAIALLQQERAPSTKFANLGDAVRQWMQQSQ
ncbi:hypothetical protein P43SY_008785 [Pythium insidiosum]|uniref:Uncharacterized protein n=1 Tax=Pythium insidiosum TaxID=114742 RepID=A0AAD5Q8I0_PYTIN|nr:hypothetical protein P43SY_008785 [Pythium insidiosum]